MKKAARKHLSEKDTLKDLREDIRRIYKETSRFSCYTYAQTAHLCELEWSNNKTSECKQLAQAYKNLRSYSSMHEMKKIKSLQDQINAKSSMLPSLYATSSNIPVVTFLEEEKEKLEQEVKRNNNGHIPTSIPAYFDSLTEEDQKELVNIIKNAVRKKITNNDELAEEFEKTLNVFREKL